MEYVKRYVSSHFWDDNYIIDLDPTEKLLFIYFLTNPLTRISGFYEISLKRIAFDTGIDRDMVAKILGRFEEAEKIYYCEGFVIIPNFPKYQLYNPNMKKSILNDIESAPESLKQSKGFKKLLKAFKDSGIPVKIEEIDDEPDETQKKDEDLSKDSEGLDNHSKGFAKASEGLQRLTKGSEIYKDEDEDEVEVEDEDEDKTHNIINKNNIVCRDNSVYTARSYKNSSKPTAAKSSTSPPKENKSQSVVIELPLNNGENFQITKENINMWQSDFPNTDVLSELRKMHAWLDANPKKRKTKSGIKRFIVNWLSREQDKNKNSPQTQGKTRTLPDGTVVSNVAYKTWENIKDWKPKEVEGEG